MTVKISPCHADDFFQTQQFQCLENFLQRKKPSFENDGFLGRSNEIRTHGLLHPMQTRYQTAPYPGNIDNYTRSFSKNQVLFSKNNKIFFTTEKPARRLVFIVFFTSELLPEEPCTDLCGSSFLPDSSGRWNCAVQTGMRGGSS